MGQFSFDVQDVNITGSGTINIVSGSITPVVFQDIDHVWGPPLPGEQISFDGGTTFVDYTYLGVAQFPADDGGTERGVVIDVGGTILVASTDATNQLSNGNTRVALGDLEPNPPVPPTFPVPPLACFVRGTRLLTVDGERPVESLRPGDRLVCAGDEVDTIRWIGHRHLDPDLLAWAVALCPVRISAGALGPSLPRRDLLVSPQHRMLLSNWRAELMFGEREVLTEAQHLCNGSTISQILPVDGVDYYHILFDRHRIIYAEGSATESFHPGDYNTSGFDHKSQNELLHLFPQLSERFNLYGPAARRCLKADETDLLLQGTGVAA